MQSDTAPAGNTLDLDALARETYSAVYADVCDTLGMRFRTLEPGARHIAGPDRVLIGHARTAISMPVDEIPERPYGGEIDFVDSLGDGDLVVLDCSRAPAAAWGELFSTASAGRGARGALIDGVTRDVAKINELDRFPVFARGSRPTDALGRVAIREWDVPVCVYGLTVFPGDLVICDSDGVTVVPRKHIPEVVPRVLEKASIESEARQLLLEGGYLRDVWENFRVL